MFDFMKKLAIIITIVFVAYCVFMFGMPQYKYYAFKTDAADIVRFTFKGRDDREKVEKLRKEMFEKAQEVGLPISENHIKVESTETGYWVYIKWQETVDILGQYQKTFEFEVEVSS
jgi:hypothetical protein